MSSTRSILVVEDSSLSRELIKRRLERLGYVTVMAVDGQEGVALAQSEMPDLILMDLHLPVMDGWTATQTIKSMEQTKHIPVIALTAHTAEGDREKALQAGCDDFDTKPVNFNRLSEKMERLLPS